MDEYIKQAIQIIRTNSCKGVACGDNCFCWKNFCHMQKNLQLKSDEWNMNRLRYTRKFLREDKLKRILNG